MKSIVPLPFRSLHEIALFLAFVAAFSPVCLLAEPYDEDAFHEKVEAQEKKLLENGKLLPLEKLFRNGAATSLPAFAEPSTVKLEPPELHDKLLASTLVVGLYYKCHKCSQMHFETGGGFAVAPGGIVSTCAHMLMKDAKLMREAYPIAIDAAGKVYPIDRLLAFDAESDTCLVHVVDADFPVLSMRPAARVGESIYCLSHPGENLFIFTSGMVSRVDSQREKSRAVKVLQVSCEYSPGSSGCPITDAAGNVLAQVDKIDPQILWSDEDAQSGTAATVYNLRSATAAEEILRLTNPANRPDFDLASMLDNEESDPVEPKSDKPEKNISPEATPGPVAERKENPFIVGSSYELVIAPKDLDLAKEVKSFTELYRLNVGKINYTPWADGHEPHTGQTYGFVPNGFTAVTGYFRVPKKGVPVTAENTASRDLNFKYTFANLKAASIDAHVAVIDRRFIETPTPYVVDVTIPKNTFQLIKLGPPEQDTQAWLALQVDQISEDAAAPPVAPVKMLPGNKVSFKFTAVDGREVDTDKMLGKVILVDFWATWCGPCVEALPRIEELYKKYHERGFEIIGINLDANRLTMENFLKSHPHPWPQSISAPGGKNPLADPLKIESLPTFLLIDKTGVYTAIEARNPDTEDKIEALLEK